MNFRNPKKIISHEIPNSYRKIEDLLDDPNWEEKIDLDDPKAYLRMKRKASILADFELIKKRRQERKVLEAQEKAQIEISETQRAMRRVYEQEYLQAEAGSSSQNVGVESPPNTPGFNQSQDQNHFGLERSESGHSSHSLNSMFRKIN